MRNIFRKFVVISLTMLMLSWMALPVMASPTVTFALSETSFSPNGDGFRDVTTVWFNLSSDANVSIRILKGTTVVATLHNNAALAAGSHAFIWGGTTNLSSGPVLPDGRYTMLIQANDGTGTGEVSGDFYILSHLITAGMIENGSITRDKLAFGAVDGARIAAHSIGMDQLATITVLSGNIGDGSVTEPKIAANAVTTPKIADGAVTGAKIANGTIGQAQINSVGLDADTLDGKHAAAFDSADASETAARIAADAADATAWANADTADVIAWGAADNVNALADAADTLAWIAGDNALWTALGNATATLNAADTADAIAWGAGDDDLWTALGSATATINSNLTTLSNQLTTETNNRQTADADRLNSSALGSNVRIVSGETTISTSVVGDTTSAINFGGAFTSPPSIVITNLSALSDLGAKVVNLRSRPIATDSGEIGLRIDANGAGTGTAYLRWIAIGN